MERLTMGLFRFEWIRWINSFVFNSIRSHSAIGVKHENRELLKVRVFLAYQLFAIFFKHALGLGVAERGCFSPIGAHQVIA